MCLDSIIVVKHSGLLLKTWGFKPREAPSEVKSMQEKLNLWITIGAEGKEPMSESQCEAIFTFHMKFSHRERSVVSMTFGNLL